MYWLTNCDPSKRELYERAGKLAGVEIVYRDDPKTQAENDAMLGELACKPYAVVDPDHSFHRYSERTARGLNMGSIWSKTETSLAVLMPYLGDLRDY